MFLSDFYNDFSVNGCGGGFHNHTKRLGNTSVLADDLSHIIRCDDQLKDELAVYLGFYDRNSRGVVDDGLDHVNQHRIQVDHNALCSDS